MWKKSIIVLLLGGTLAACNNGTDDETPMNDNEQGASDFVTPYDNDNGIDGVNHDYNGSDRGLYMNEDNANVDTPTSNKDSNGNNGATSNGGNNMNGAGGNHGQSGNNSTNDKNSSDWQNSAMDPRDRAADRVFEDGENIVDDVLDGRDFDDNNR